MELLKLPRPYRRGILIMRFVRELQTRPNLPAGEAGRKNISASRDLTNRREFREGELKLAVIHQSLIFTMSFSLSTSFSLTSSPNAF